MGSILHLREGDKEGEEHNGWGKEGGKHSVGEGRVIGHWENTVHEGMVVG